MGPIFRLRIGGPVEGVYHAKVGGSAGRGLGGSTQGVRIFETEPPSPRSAEPPKKRR